MQILCAFRSPTSYQRMKSFLEAHQIEWSENIQSFDELREEMGFSSWQVAIIDSRLWWQEEAKEILSRFAVDVISFDGDFEVVINQLHDYLPEKGEESEEIDLAPETFPEVPEEDDTPVRYIEKRVIEEKEVRIEVQVPVKTYASIPSQLCYFISLSPRSGATFLAANLAAALATRQLHCTVLEYPKGRVSLYDLLNVGVKSENYEPPYKQLKEYGFFQKGKDFFYNGISFHLNHPSFPDPKVTYEDLLKMIYQIRSSINLFDISSFWNDPDFMTLLPEADHVFLVIDPDPALIERIAPPEEGVQPTPEHSLVQRLLELHKQKQIQVHFIINKDSNGVDHKVLRELPFSVLAYIPHFEPALVYQANWKGELLYEREKDLMEQHLQGLIKQIVPPEYFYLEKPEKQGLLDRIKFFKKS
ncbi:hypothetical protein [Brevibacillus brevis]|uniref:CobQ/CobB/MinD/ParA nucleotide binding domain-containing protein n=1 Tax=Brevibacillus brevis TaxID=1393 RepID=A0ABY9TCR1_BREBE|nr:hypothetical protein [Brevibacillus brevis]WNC17904.1 hypothetical protein RGB73_30510 [Brevibacillus brevis]